ncbi:hypothetical protein SAMN02745121_04888 [Nannocystis exedens]|uniref:Uncharacterized protein n=1 Tax=Nannocystis exedens TaxID=54 RepID=A0A1I2C2H2_9BACT|nr:hypothetical protein [Nannocystis exedens]PCC71148.1 hypothetical protein NAEX_04222 [Nannocystis exedens]SFE61800.1 hypothetical protein SAMN02745121_04888 [Nannocystis exedens]
MSRSSDIVARSGRRIAGYLGGSAVLLLGSWYALSPGDGPAPPPVPAPEPVVALGVQAADADPAGRSFDDFDPRPDHVAPSPPPIEPVPEDMLTAERRAWLADPGPRVEVDANAQATLESARAAATAELQKVLDDRRNSLLRACGGKDASNIFVQATFGADGKLLAREFADHGNDTAVRECLQSQPFAMSIPPPGVELRVRGVLAPR